LTIPAGALIDKNSTSTNDYSFAGYNIRPVADSLIRGANETEGRCEILEEKRNYVKKWWPLTTTHLDFYQCVVSPIVQLDGNRKNGSEYRFPLVLELSADKFL